ncbi:hypothetical protein VP01_467g3 [Puccinia sorghi]|uniref:Pre-rRNA-processing protein n=1 Tax=Puccinia sorghi TaxID=27349 RepID=A0A0L6UN41_9BASI|nr:hypothetical protein VP01_467g3 [Puccinia sorghi]
MPKSQKQKKTTAADFTKPKLKLGKGKHVSSDLSLEKNYVVLSVGFFVFIPSFAAIALPNQKIRTENALIPSTRSNLTLDDLIPHSHFCYHGLLTQRPFISRSHIFVDALLGLREILEAHRTIWRLNLGTIIHSCASLISDENAGVRKALKNFFSWFLPRVDSPLLKPFCPVIIFFASSALSHIFPDIRVDAIYIIDILLDVAPNSVVAGWPRDRRTDLHLLALNPQSTNLAQQPGLRLLQLYLSLLSVGSDSAAPGLSSTSANQLSENVNSVFSFFFCSFSIVMKSLARFIGAASSLDRREYTKNYMPLWIFRTAFRNERDFDAFHGLLSEMKPPTHDESAGMSVTTDAVHYSSTNSHRFERFSEAFLESDCFQESIASPPCVRAESSGASNQAPSSHPIPESSLHLIRALHPVLLAIFLDTAPAAFQSEFSSTSRAMTKPSSEASVSHTLELIDCVITCLHRLWQATLAADLSIETKDVKSLETFLIKISPYFVFGGDDIAPQGTELKHLLQHLNLMYCDLVSLLALVKPDCNNTVAIQQVSHHDSNIDHAFRGIFPIIWSLLRHDLMQRANPKAERESWASRMVEAFIDHLNYLSPTSELKYLGINFLARLCIVSPLLPPSAQQQTGKSRMDDLPGCQLACELDVLSPETQNKIREWMMGLPKLLWQLGAKTPATTHVSGRSSIPQLVLSFLHRVVSRPMMFFHCCFAELGPLLAPFFSSNHPATGRPIPGPYGRLPSSCRILADGISWFLLNHTSPASGPLTSALRSCRSTLHLSTLCSC